MDASHPIFQGPFPVTLTLVDIPTPDNYRHFPEGRQLAASMPAWRVHAQPVGGYVGVVADGYGFEDSPDAEWIASGRNSKGPRSAALARHGNFFHWGFAASPAEMTAEARTVFLNTMVYMRRFDGHPPLAVGNQRSREWLRVYLGSDEGLNTYSRSKVPASWLETAGEDLAALAALCAAELGFLQRAGKGWQVDQDCRRLGIDNRTVQGLRRCVDLLDQPAERDAAQRVLERYTGRTFPDAAGWRGWLDEVGERLFHSDLAERFAVAPADLPPPHRR